MPLSLSSLPLLQAVACIVTYGTSHLLGGGLVAYWEGGERLPVEGGCRTFRVSFNDDSFGGKGKRVKGNGRSCDASAHTGW
jgi:hypothetical protein